MKQKVFLILMLLSFGLSLTNILAQTAFTSAGGDLSGNGGSVSYSAGQVFNQTQEGTTGTIQNGVQQPYVITVTTDLKQLNEINLSISTYPNPTTDNLKLSIEADDLSNTHIELCDLSGKVLKSEKITNRQTIIEMGQFSPSTYFVKICLNNKKVKTYKIIKK